MPAQAGLSAVVSTKAGIQDRPIPFPTLLKWKAALHAAVRESWIPGSTRDNPWTYDLFIV